MARIDRYGLEESLILFSTIREIRVENFDILVGTPCRTRNCSRFKQARKRTMSPVARDIFFKEIYKTINVHLARQPRCRVVNNVGRHPFRYSIKLY